MPITVNSTVSTPPCLPEGGSPGARQMVFLLRTGAFLSGGQRVMLRRMAATESIAMNAANQAAKAIFTKKNKPPFLHGAPVAQPMRRWRDPSGHRGPATLWAVQTRHMGFEQLECRRQRLHRDSTGRALRRSEASQLKFWLRRCSCRSAIPRNGSTGSARAGRRACPGGFS